MDVKAIDLNVQFCYFSHTEQVPNRGACEHRFSASSTPVHYLLLSQAFTMAHLNRFPAMIRGTVREPGARREPAELMRIRELDPRSRCGEARP